ncbi:hypothetical protein C8Q73DRAFT_643503 [Cubamyces lactineus]|nr:hypothetical protein C8Q73DRAFT_643503 [Cubamyces lactineus]
MSLELEYESYFNFSPHILKSYPETSPWDLTPEVFSVRPQQTAPCPNFPDNLKHAALVQAKKSKLNPFHFMCGRNPFVLDTPPPSDATVPMAVSAAAPPLMPWLIPDNVRCEFVEELHAGDGAVIYRIRAGQDMRVLKLYIGDDASARFHTEVNAYAYMASRNVTGVVPHCFGWIDLDGLLKRDQGCSSPLLAVLCGKDLPVSKGLVLEDLAGAQCLSIHNISLDIGEAALRALHVLHSMHILHGNPEKGNVLVFPETKRVAWVGFSHAVCQGLITKQALFAELAEGWAFIYQRLIPDAFIGWEAGPDAIDPRTLVDDVTPAPIQPTHARPSKSTITEEAIAILASYPDINLYSWDPPIQHLTPGHIRDHQYDTDEFLQAIRNEHKTRTFNLFGRWYGPCPLRTSEAVDIITENSDEWCNYDAPPPVRQLPTETDIEFLEYLKHSSNHPLVRVRIGSAERLLKIFSMNWGGKKNGSPCKPRFWAERGGYAHLMHYGACAAGAVPQCYGWIELSRKHVDNANAAIRRAYEPEPPPWSVFPVFEDGSPSGAIVLEYLPGSEPISYDNITPTRADLALRSLSRVHCSYVLHNDITVGKNLCLIRGHGGTPDRVVVVDFDHVKVSSWKKAWPFRAEFYDEFLALWIHFYVWMIPMQRTFCKAETHPHTLDL